MIAGATRVNAPEHASALMFGRRAAPALFKAVTIHHCEDKPPLIAAHALTRPKRLREKACSALSALRRMGPPCKPPPAQPLSDAAMGARGGGTAGCGPP